MGQKQSWFWPKKFFLAKKPMKVICTWRDFAMAPFYDSHLGTVAIAGSQMHSGVQMQPNLSSASRRSSRIRKAPILCKSRGRGIGWNAPQPTPGKFLQIVHIFVSPSKLPAEQSEKHKVDSLGGEMVEVALSNFWWGFSMIVTPQ